MLITMDAKNKNMDTNDAKTGDAKTGDAKTGDAKTGTDMICLEFGTGTQGFTLHAGPKKVALLGPSSNPSTPSTQRALVESPL